ncbi:hypothetical protein Taro_041897 [Colocasia esculenta]|uniref:ATP-dependent (S)-NAD(P)H-hydrate dehydratase n=1 Tax=Colocasia esculenta TaxID=4460 RepID=A0A843WN03_COLES|nr:hypothetical protein [Colocasia esculenta]
MVAASVLKDLTSMTSSMPLPKTLLGIDTVPVLALPKAETATAGSGPVANWTIEIGVDRFKIPDILFNPSIVQGADLSHVFCTKDAAPVIKSYSPELIVHPVLEESYSVRDDEKASVSQKVLAEATKWMERFDCLVVGPGLGRDPFLLDGLFLVTNNLDLITGYPLAVLTPNVNEYKRLVEKILGRNVDDHDAPEELLSLSRSIGGATILRKGKADLISDGKNVSMVSIFGSPRRCGGQGDILSGRLVSCNYLSFLDMYVPFVNNCTALCCEKAFLPVAIVFMLTKKSSHSPILRRV